MPRSCTWRSIFSLRTITSIGAQLTKKPSFSVPMAEYTTFGLDFRVEHSQRFHEVVIKILHVDEVERLFLGELCAFQLDAACVCGDGRLQDATPSAPHR